MVQAAYHRPALVNEVVGLLDVKPGDRCVDSTIGDGGHAEAILKATAPDGKLLGIDADPKSLQRAGERLRPYSERVILRNDNFANLENVAQDSGFTPVMAVLMDLGLASWHYESSGRGFSFMEKAPLDMRLNPDQPVSASDVVNTYSEIELTELISTYGEEPMARRIARAIVSNRPIRLASDLASAVEKAAPRRGRRIHPATRTFQAIRIVVNRELENLESALGQAVRILAKGGWLAVIAYHSLEDRVVKSFMRRESRDCICPQERLECACGHVATIRLLSRKVLKPTREEVLENPRIRSARLRACMAIGAATEQ